MAPKRKFLNFRLMPYMLLFAIVGILLISLLDFAFSIVAISIFFVIVIVCFSAKKFRNYSFRVLALFITFLVFVLAGGIVASEVKEYKAPIKSATIIATINSDSDIEGKVSDDNLNMRYSMVLDNIEYYGIKEKGKLDGKIKTYINVPVGKTFKVGDRMVINADIIPKYVKLTESANVHNYIEGIRYTLDNAVLVEIVDGKASLGESIKVRARDAMINFVPSGGIMYSMIFGDKIVMDNEFISSVNKTGIAHLFAVSGLHVGLVASIVSYITKKCKANKFVDYIIVLLLTGLYSLLVGFGPSVARAFLMLAIYKSGKLLGMRHCGISSLSLSCLIILLVSPLELFNMSFQLSVMAIVGILFFEKPIHKLIKTKWKAFNTFVAMNLSVNIAVLPIMLHYFGSVSLIFLLANLLVVPFITLVFPFIFIFVLLSSAVSQIAYVLLPLGYVFSFIELLINLIAKIPFLAVNICLNIYWVVGYIVLLVIISSYSLIRSRTKGILAGLLCLIIIVASVLTSFGRIDGSAKFETVATNTNYDIVMMDVKDEHYLIVNGEFNVYAMYKCKSYIYEKNIDKIDGIVKSTFTASEMEIVFELYNAINIEKVITNENNDVLKDMFMDKIYFAHIVGDYMIAPVNSSVIDVYSKDTSICFVDNRKKNEINLKDNVDILYCVGDNSFIYNNLPDYFVNDNAVMNNIPQSVNSYFTFIIKNAKIKVI